MQSTLQAFSNTKKKAESDVNFDHLKAFCCGFDYVFDDTNNVDGDGNKTDTMVDDEPCGYKPLSNNIARRRSLKKLSL